MIPNRDTSIFARIHCGVALSGKAWQRKIRRDNLPRAPPNPHGSTCPCPGTWPRTVPNVCHPPKGGSERCNQKRRVPAAITILFKLSSPKDHIGVACAEASQQPPVLLDRTDPHTVAVKRLVCKVSRTARRCSATKSYASRLLVGTA